jgi:TolB protein
MLCALLLLDACGASRHTAPPSATADAGPDVTDAGADQDAGSSSPIPRLAYVSNASGSYAIVVAAGDGAMPRTVSRTGGTDLYPAWAPNDTTIVFARSSGGYFGLVALDLASSTETAISIDVPNATAPAISPDGMTIAFEGRASDTGDTDIYTAPIAGGHATKLTGSPGNDVGPAWSPDGHTLYFGSDRSGGSEIWSMNADGSGQRAETSGAHLLGRPTVSADGVHVAYTQLESMSASSVIVRDLSKGTEMITGALNDSEPAFSPCPHQLALTTARFGSPEVALIDLSTMALTQLTHDSAIDGAATFAPSICP